MNSYLVWDARTRTAAAFDTGADCGAMLDLIATERLRLQMIFLTHTHDDHVADLARLAKETGAEVWASEREPADHPGARTFKENAHFHVGGIAIKTLLDLGPLARPDDVLRDGPELPPGRRRRLAVLLLDRGQPHHFADQYENDVEKILTPAPKHGPRLRPRPPLDRGPGEAPQSVLRYPKATL